MTAVHDVASGVVAELACRPLFQLQRDAATGVWQPEGGDPQFIVSLGDAHLSPGLYRFTARIGSLGRAIQPCLYVADDQHWNEATRVALQSPLADGVWSAVIDVDSGLHEVRFDPVDAQVDFMLGPVWLQKLGDVDAAAFLVRALVERHPAAQLPAVRERLMALLARGDMAGVRRWLAHGDLPVPDAAGHKAGHDARYAEWVARYDTPDAQELARMTEAVAAWPQRPLISIVMPVYNTAEAWLRRCLDSVRAQACPDWELCIADDASTAPHVRAVLDEYVARDSRIKVVYRERNGHISAASNSALELATGAWIALLDHDDELAPHALFRVGLAVQAHPQGRLFYSDEDKLDESGRRFDPYFKPDWNPDLFLSHNFISHLGVYATELVREVGGFRVGFEGSQDYDLALRCIERLQPGQVVHIPHVLYHWRAIHGSTALAVGEKGYAAQAARKALQEHLQRTAREPLINPASRHPGESRDPVTFVQRTEMQSRGVPDIASQFRDDEQNQGFPGAAEVEFGATGYRVRRVLAQPHPSVDIVIAVQGDVGHLGKCIASVLGKTTCARFGVMVVVDPSTEESVRGRLREAGADTRVNVLRMDAACGLPRMLNAAVARSTADLVVLLHGHAEVLTGDWLETLAAHALRPEVGAVGAKRYAPDGSLWDAGMVLGLSGLAGHLYRGEPHAAWGQMGRAQLIQNYSVVSGACLMVGRAKFNAVGGLDEALRTAFCAVDLCLKLRARGYWNVWTPFAELCQHAAAGGPGDDAYQSDAAHMRQVWGGQLDDDPAYNPNLSLSGEPCGLAFPPRVRTSAVRGLGFVDDSRAITHGDTA